MLTITNGEGTPMTITKLEWVEKYNVYKITATPIDGGPDEYFGGTKEQVADVLEAFANQDGDK